MMPPTPATLRNPRNLYGLTLLQWAVIAVAFHITISLVMYFVSVSGIVPHLAQGPGGNWKGTWEFVPDSGDTLNQSHQVAEWFRTEQWGQAAAYFGAWSVGTAAKVYAIPCALFGNSLLSTIPVNTLIYLGTLAIVFMLGRTLLDRETGFWAAVLVALWPSSLLHMTQPIKDPIYILGQLCFLCSLVLLVGRHERFRPIFQFFAIGWLGFSFSSLVRPQGMGLNLLAWTAAMLVPFVRLAITRRREPWIKYVAMVALWCLFTNHVTLMMRGTPWERDESAPPSPTIVNAMAAHAAPYPTPTAPPQGRAANAPLTALDRLMDRVNFIVKRVGYKRFEWGHSYIESKSNIDTHVRIETLSAIVAYAPRALQIGLFAPFPPMWMVEARRVGRVGRMISAAEMSAIYLLIPLAFLGIWRERRRLETWIVTGFVGLGLLSLGLLVTNLGAIYRMRYGYWFALFVLSAVGVRHLSRVGGFKRLLWLCTIGIPVTGARWIRRQATPVTEFNVLRLDLSRRTANPPEAHAAVEQLHSDTPLLQTFIRERYFRWFDDSESAIRTARRRFARGETCFARFAGGRMLAQTWVRRDGLNEPEVQQARPLSSGEVTLYDSYTLPAFRGQGHFSAAVQAVARHCQSQGTADALLTIVEGNNVASLAANRRAGFETVVFRCWRLRFLDRAIIRSLPSRIPVAALSSLSWHPWRVAQDLLQNRAPLSRLPDDNPKASKIALQPDGELIGRPE